MIARLILAACAALLWGVGAGLALSQTNAAAVLGSLVVWLGVAGVARSAAPASDRALLVLLTSVAFALRFAVAAVLYTGSVTLDRDGFITGDDADYARLSWAYVRFIAGDPQQSIVPPYWGGLVYLFGTYVYLESIVFALFGHNVLLVEVLNSGFAALSLALLFDIAGRLFSPLAAWLAVSLHLAHPSLVLWAALNLKEALALLLIVTVLWLATRFQLRPAAWALVAALAVLIPMESLRRYAFVGLTLLVPVAVALTPRLGPRPRLAWTAVAAALAVGLLALPRETPPLPAPLQSLESLERTRQAMAVGARTAFQEPTPIPVRLGDTFAVVQEEPRATALPAARAAPTTDSSPSTPHEREPDRPVSHREPTVTPPAIQGSPPAVSAAAATTTTSPTTAPPMTPTSTPATTLARQAGATSAPTAVSTPLPTAPGVMAGVAGAGLTPRIIAVPPGAALVVVSSPAPAREPSANPRGVPVVEARPGDIVVVGEAGRTPAPPNEWRALSARPSDGGERVVQLYPAERAQDVVQRTFTYLPRGLAHALFAPFPWALGRWLDLFTLPEMLLWYLLLLAAVVTVWRHRARWQVLAPLVLYVAGILLVLALGEGNVGTLFRHRAMAIPVVILLASDTVILVGKSLSFRSRSRGG